MKRQGQRSIGSVRLDDRQASPNPYFRRVVKTNKLNKLIFQSLLGNVCVACGFFMSWVPCWHWPVAAAAAVMCHRGYPELLACRVS